MPLQQPSPSLYGCKRCCALREGDLVTSALGVPSAQLALDIEEGCCQLRLQQRIHHNANDLLPCLQLLLHLAANTHS